MNFKSSLVFGLTFIFAATLFSKNIYLKYDPSCMDRYEYRLNDNKMGSGLISYYIRANNSTKVMMEIGVESIRKVKRMPNGTKICSKIKANEVFVKSINEGTNKVYIVRKVGKYYTVSPVHLATYIKDNNGNFAMKGHQFDLSYTKDDIGVMEHNLASRNSSTKVYFIGSDKEACNNTFVLKKIPEETCKPFSDITYIPGIGITQEKTGTTQADADRNVLRLVKINNVPLAEFIVSRCNGKETEITAKYQPEAEILVEKTPTLKPSTTSQPADSQTQPDGYEVIFEAQPESIAAAYRPASNEVIYTYNEPQRPVEVFRPKGIDCKNISYPGVHIVQTSQTLYGISRRYGVTVAQLQDWNKLGEKDLIKPCASLYVLPPEQVLQHNSIVEHTPKKVEKVQDEFTAKGSGTALLFPKSNTAPESLSVTKAQNTSVTKDEVYANISKQSELLFPKSNATPKVIEKSLQSKDGCAKSTTKGMHIVQKGETLYRIASDNKITVEQLVTWNQLGNDGKIKPCMSLYIEKPATTETNKTYTIPSSEISTSYTNAPTNSNISKGAANVAATDKMWNSNIEHHIVQKGETLAGLAKMYGFTIERFKDINGIGESNIISIGQVLRTGNCLCPVAEETKKTAIKSTTQKEKIATTQQSNRLETNATTRKTERVVDVSPTLAPYNYEAESAIINTKNKKTVSTRNGRKIHTVKENETLSFIANLYDIPLKVLRKLNDMEKGEVIIPHQKIYLE